LGPVDEANAILRRAQFGYRTQKKLESRTGLLPTDEYFQLVSPAKYKLIALSKIEEKRKKS
jgi:hypothetical protein